MDVSDRNTTRRRGRAVSLEGWKIKGHTVRVHHLIINGGLSRDELELLSEHHKDKL